MAAVDEEGLVFQVEGVDEDDFFAFAGEEYYNMHDFF
jgi:hypothetical protein